MNYVRNIIIGYFFGALAVLFLVIFLGFQIPKINTQYSMRQFFPKDHPVITQDDRIEKEFQLRAAPAFFAIVELPEHESGTWLDGDKLGRLKALSDSFAALPEVKAAVSIANVEMAYSKGSELRVGSLIDALPQTEWKDKVEHEPSLSPQLISRDHRSALVVIEPKSFSTNELATLDGKLREVLRVKADGLRAGLAGVPVVQTKLAQKLRDEIGRFLILCLVIFVLMFAVFYRGLIPIIFVGIGLIACNSAVLGTVAFFGIAFSTLLSTLPIIVSIAFVSLAIHTLHLWSTRLEEAGRPRDFEARVRLSIKTLKELFIPNFLGSATTAIGFATLATTAIPAVREYALVISAGVMMAFLLTQAVMFLALPFMTPVARTWVGRPALWMKSIIRRAGPIVATISAVVVVLTICMGLGVVDLNFSSRLFDDLPETDGIHGDMDRVDSAFGGTVDLNVVINTRTKDAWKDPVRLQKLSDALKQIRAFTDVGYVLGLTDFLGPKVPNTPAATAEAYFLYSLSQINPLVHFVDNDVQNTRISVRVADLASDRVDALRAKIRTLLASTFPEGAIEESGLAVTSHTVNRDVAKELMYGFWQSLFVIGVLLCFIFRSFRLALVACVPNLVPPAILIGVLAIFHTPVKPAIALIFSIALGLAFNNTVYLLSRLKKLGISRRSSALALKQALLQEGNPCLSESLLTFAGFLIFLSSGFKLNQTFGAYMVLSIVAGALADLVFLPAILKLFPTFIPKFIETIKGKRIVKPAGQHVVVMFSAVSGLATMTLSQDARADEAADLLKAARGHLEAKSDVATVSLKIIEANGDTKTRKLTLKTLQDGSTFKALVRILEPADIKGTALLAEVKGGEESQWLYLPSSKQVRRVVSGKKSAGVLGSELSPEDLSAESLQGASAKLVKKDASKAIIDVKPKAGSEYSKIELELSIPDDLPQTIQYYVGEKVKKRVEFKDYVALGPKVKRAKHIVVKNLENNRGTNVDLSDMKINIPSAQSEFNVEALKGSD
jgi:predicted RND superfamily exporter protein